VGVDRQAGKEGKHCAHVAKRTLSVSETLTETETVKVLARG